MRYFYKEFKDIYSCQFCSFASVEDGIREELGSVLRGQLKELIADKMAEIDAVDESDAMKRAYLSDYLKGLDIDLLVIYNLAGFELCTLTDGLAYNLVDCRQLHIIEKKEVPGEKYLNKEKSINMFLWNRR